MADNVSIDPGTTTPIATDDISGVQYQRVKVCHGADGAASDASDSTPLPVKDAPATALLASISEKTVPTASAQAVGTSAACTRGVLVQAPVANTDAVCVGGSGITTSTGLELLPGDSAFFPVDNVADVYCIADVSNQTLRIVGV